MSPLGGIEAVGGPLRVLDPQEGWKPDTLLDRATALWRADAIHPSGQRLNDLSGNGHHAQFGSTPNADTNDPLILPYRKGDDKYLSLPGRTNNYASTPDVNLLPSNAAHVTNPSFWMPIGTGVPTSIVEWAELPEGMKAVTISFELDSTSATRLQSNNNIPMALPVSPGQTLTFSWLMPNDEWDGTIQIAFDNSIPEQAPQKQMIRPGVWEYWRTLTVPPGASVIEHFRHYLRQGVRPSSHTFAAFCLKEGTDPTFVPSTRIVGDFDIRVKINPSSWTPGSSTWGICNAMGLLRIGDNNRFRFHYDHAEGSNQVVVNYSAGLLEGTQDIRVVVVQSSELKVQRLVGSNWVDIGTTNLPHHILPRDGLNFGDSNWPIKAEFYSFELRDGIDGPVVARFDANNAVEPHQTVPGGAGETWTINRSTTGMKATLVDRPLLLFGGNKYLEVPHHDDLDPGTGDYTVLIMYRMFEDSNSNKALIAKREIHNSADDEESNPGWILFSNTSAITVFRIGNPLGGVNHQTNTMVRQGTVQWTAGRLEGGDMTLLESDASINSGSRATVADVFSARNLTIGVRGDYSSSHFVDMEFIGAAIFREALTDYEISQVADYLKEVF